GDAVFEIRQNPPFAIRLPYREAFSSGVPPAPIWMLDKHDRHDDQGEQVDGTRWFLDDQSDRHLKISVEASGPAGGKALLIESNHADPRQWATQVELPEIEVEDHAKYVLSLSLRAEVPGSVWLSFSQRSEPYHDCGLSSAVAVTNSWSEFRVPFWVSGTKCGASNNRLAIQTGNISGKLWMANVTLERAAD
ncbi:MAG TPA: hypothetical protein VNZ26_29010, partial [Vicinamibacterales bacterium]|nr:hypothetical protein [Vicinamibacterales bacterium]